MAAMLIKNSVTARPTQKVAVKSSSANRAAAAFSKSSMHGSQFAVSSLKTVRKNATKQVTQASASSGFLLDMSDLIENGSTVKVNTEKECALGVSFYPDFAYNAEGGGGVGKVTAMDIDGKVAINFDPLTLNVPTLETSTADLMGLPLPPLFRAEIRANSLSGFIEKRSGKVDLQFDAEVVPAIGSVQVGQAIKLFINLTTETSWGATRSARGKRLDSEGRCVLVGVARLPPSTDPITSTLLMLPTDALAVLQVRFEFAKNRA
eukprot:CAMPEP_0118932102 /NCGR_PEP_ID=MMETSP1169-20130426/9106_1 /TAXON_ID=36882 /ORGANISM="Pyramimonas obovata, Strain CCMP722" /LENGTH=262 /DNA_ID=CAMNT_0006874707 /DNA_START=62 /DNA_END=850 /DNA_ORIENTATION=-